MQEHFFRYPLQMVKISREESTYKMYCIVPWDLLFNPFKTIAILDGNLWFDTIYKTDLQVHNKFFSAVFGDFM